MGTILAFDPGTKCGWCCRHSEDRIDSGVWNLKGGRFEGGGMRFLRLRGYLRELLDNTQPALVAFEEVRRHMGTDAAHVYGGILAVITEECEVRQIPYHGIPVATVKKYATGKGNAKKDAMMMAAKAKWGREFKDDNEADARWIAEAASATLEVADPSTQDDPTTPIYL